jgi:hypothetical protein
MSSGASTIDFSSADEVRRLEKTTMEIINVGATKVARLTAQPGWVWSECIAPVVGTDSCQAHHLGIVQSGQLHVQHEDGTEITWGPGDVYRCTPGHQAQVVGDEPCVMIEFNNETAATYAKDN